MRAIKDIQYSEVSKACVLDIYLPDNADTFDVFVYFHGGGLVGGDKAGQPVMTEYLTASGVAVVSANYRMYPDAKYPEFIIDAAAAVGYTVRNISQYGRCRGIYVGGSSAGGYLSQMLCYNKNYLEAAGVTQTQIAGYILDAGQPTVHFNVVKERGFNSSRVMIDEAAPIYYIGAEKEFRPALVIVSDDDMENRYEQTVLLMSTLKHFKYDPAKTELRIMHGKHCAYVNAKDETGTSIFGKLILDFMKKTM